MKAALMWLLAAIAPAALAQDIGSKAWIHGAADCAQAKDPPVEVFRHDEATYVLRQNKCVHYEAPFIYVLFGSHTVLVEDTGATGDPQAFPLYATVAALIAARGTPLKVLVVHSHGHRDHTAGDAQFRGQPGVAVVEPTLEAVRRQFGLSEWPNGSGVLDLGGRELVVVPIPGHHEQSIALYDPRTRWLLTGDTLYPGRLYVEDWAAYRASIERLATFAKTHPVAAIMGTHIELSTSGEAFAPGSTYRPGEAPLPLAADDLAKLAELLRAAGDEPREIQTPRFIVVPLPLWARVLGRIIKWFDGT